MKRKLSLKDLSVKSFITSVEQSSLKGGVKSVNEDRSDGISCPQEVTELCTAPGRNTCPDTGYNCNCNTEY